MANELSYPLDEYEVENLNNETFRRIRLILRRGYRLTDPASVDVEYAPLRFEHPGSAPKVFVFSNGTLGSGEAQLQTRGLYKDRIFNTSNADNKAFDEWLKTVNPPNWWEHGRYDRQKFLWSPIITISMLLVALAIGKGMQAGFEALLHWWKNN